MPHHSRLLAAKKIVRDRRGGALVEFAIVSTVFLPFLFAVIGVGVDGVYQQALDDSVRSAARQLQMGGPASSNASSFVSAICTQLGMLDASCQTRVTYAVQASTTNGNFSSLTPQTLTAAGTYDNAFFSGNAFGPNVAVLAQVAYPLPFTLPFVGSMLTWTNTGSIVTTAAVRAEPYQ